MFGWCHTSLTFRSKWETLSNVHIGVCVCVGCFSLCVLCNRWCEGGCCRTHRCVKGCLTFCHHTSVPPVFALTLCRHSTLFTNTNDKTVTLDSAAGESTHTLQLRHTDVFLEFAINEWAHHIYISDSITEQSVSCWPSTQSSSTQVVSLFTITTKQTWDQRMYTSLFIFMNLN